MSNVSGAGKHVNCPGGDRHLYSTGHGRGAPCLVSGQSMRQSLLSTVCSKYVAGYKPLHTQHVVTHPTKLAAPAVRSTCGERHPRHTGGATGRAQHPCAAPPPYWRGNWPCAAPVRSTKWERKPLCSSLPVSQPWRFCTAETSASSGLPGRSTRSLGGWSCWCWAISSCN